eukprot:scaffold22052_cov78-Skeletonema_dohrnii-CCMP3373.AAC.1
MTGSLLLAGSTPTKNASLKTRLYDGLARVSSNNHYINNIHQSSTGDRPRGGSLSHCMPRASALDRLSALGRCARQKTSRH